MSSPKSVKLKLRDSSDDDGVELVATISREDFAEIEERALERRNPDVSLAVLQAVHEYFSRWDSSVAKSFGKKLIKARPLE
jgi:hypothetical protein